MVHYLMLLQRMKCKPIVLISILLITLIQIQGIYINLHVYLMKSQI